MDSAAWARGPFEELARAVEAEAYTGWDPYDALSSPALAGLARTRWLRQGAIQLLKAAPVNVRPLLGIPRQAHTKGLALFVSAYARVAGLPWGEQYRNEVRVLADTLSARAIPGSQGVGWGYDFDVQTRWGRYRRGDPNAVVTAFAAHALLDAADVLGEDAFREIARESLALARSDLDAEADGERFFSYYRGSAVPVHNANLLITSVFARCGEADDAVDALRFSLSRQRPDGSWPYGERQGLSWVDGYHTAYVLWSLEAWLRAGVAEVAPALASGLDLFLTGLVDPDGAPRARLGSRYPIDVHAAASSIWMLSELGARDERGLPTAERVLAWTLSNLRRGDGHFAFQRRRLFRNNVSYVRWNDAHMLLALAAHMHSAGGSRASEDAPAESPDT